MSRSFSRPSLSGRALEAVMIGCGERGMRVYGDYARRHGTKICFVACVDPDPGRRNEFATIHGIPEDRRYAREEDFFSAPRMADAAFVCTMDRLHESQTLACLDAGYHVLLEKPMACTEEGSRRIAAKVRESGLVLVIGHVLRYAPLFAKAKELVDSGVLGKLSSVRMSENMGTWVFAHSFVRGNWNNSERSSSLILQKGCHDFDILSWLIGTKAERVACTATGPVLSRDFAPPGAPERCTDGCPHAATCIYEARRFYLEGIPMMRDVARSERPFVRAVFRAAAARPRLTGALVPPLRGLGLSPWRRWPVSQLGPDTSEEGIMKALREGPYGRCVYRCDNDQPAAISASIQFEGDVSASYQIQGMSYRDARELRMDGSKGSLVALFSGTAFDLRIHTHHDGRTRKIRFPLERGAGGGGDERIMAAFLDAVEGRGQASSNAAETLKSHLICFAAERSIRDGTMETISS